MVTREEILEAARTRMMHYGIQKTTMQEIAQDTSIAVGTLYLYFKNKEEIVLAIAEECSQEQSAVAEEILASSIPPDEKLKTFLKNKFCFVKDIRENHPHYKEFLRLVLSLSPDTVNQWRMRFEQRIQQILEDGIAQGLYHITDPQREAKILFLSIRSFIPLPYLELPEWPQEEEMLMVVDWFLTHWKAPTHVAVS